MARGWSVPYEKDIGDFDARAPGYESGWRGRLHRDIADKVVEIALASSPEPRRVLDVGSGTGYLLRELAGRVPKAVELTGIDPAPHMVEVAERAASDRRLSFRAGVAEALPFAEGSFDLVVTTTSFDHWADQRAGLCEIARVLAPKGCLVLADIFSLVLAPTLVLGRKDRARTLGRAAGLLEATGFEVLARHNLYVVVQALSACRKDREH
jgi:ubiquinone/menaquinone biosynthesis C-methylase UbiE